MQGEPAHVSIDVADVERIAALGWRGLEEAQVGGWLLRAADGFTGRSNSALVLGVAPQTDRGFLHDLARWYADRGLPPMVQIPLPGGEAIDAMLADAGWQTFDLVRFLTGDVDEIQNSTAQSLARASEGRPVSNLLAQGVLHSDGSGVVSRLDAEPDDAWLAAYHYRGAALPGHAREVLLRAGENTELCFASLRAPARDGAADAVFAVARGAVTQGWLGVTAVTVADEHRRQRHGTRLMSELAVWGAQRGARAIYLQVAADNGPALQLYAGLGFHHHHDYRYRVGSALEERFD
ncbi:MAG: GNAT family N-acetyltransferase [Geodermatophilaceae bacterium]|nr:GNAT family N-acetyltransferase [Geodermatophilaceae bacterium]